MTIVPQIRLNSLPGLWIFPLAVCLVVLLVYIYPRPRFPANAPKLVSENYPIVGALTFFTRRWDFHSHAALQSKTGNFSYYAGPNPIVGLSGDAGREAFFGSSQLGLSEGYAVLFGQVPSVKEAGADSSFMPYFSKRITHMLRRQSFAQGRDTKARLNELAIHRTGITDPFQSIYEIVYLLTMRIVGCNDIAEDRALLNRTLELFETIEQSATPATVVFPWLPSPALIKRIIASGRLYMIFKKIVDERKKTGKRGSDPLQFLIDQNDSIADIIQFVVGAVFAGLLNSGINAAAVLAYMAADTYWMNEARQEVEAVAAKYATDKSAPLVDQLSCLPLEAWESDFSTLDLLLRESIRLQLVLCAFRQNISGHDIRVGDEVIPKGAFASYHVPDVHRNPAIYKDPDRFDPTRFLPDRAEDKKTQYAFLGWGAGRHPCLGMRFAKLEQNVIVAFFIAMFDYELCDELGGPSPGIPPSD